MTGLEYEKMVQRWREPTFPTRRSCSGLPLHTSRVPLSSPLVLQPWVLTCGPGDLATSPEAACSYLHEYEFGAQGGHVWELFSEAQHDPAVRQPALVAIELLQLWRDTRGWGGWRLRISPPSSPVGSSVLSHLSSHMPPRRPFQGPFSRRPP